MKAHDFRRCSFCGKLNTEVKRLVAGPSVYICNECVSRCNMIIAVDKRGPSNVTVIRAQTNLRSIEN